MRISDWSSDVCSSDLVDVALCRFQLHRTHLEVVVGHAPAVVAEAGPAAAAEAVGLGHVAQGEIEGLAGRSEERRAGKECFIRCSTRWSLFHYKKTIDYNTHVEIRINNAPTQN